MAIKTGRRTVLKTFGLLGSALIVKPLSGYSASNIYKKMLFDVGLASYSTRNFSLHETIRMCQRMGLSSLTLKSMHLPLDSTDGEIKKAIALIKDAGIKPAAGSVIYMKTKAEVDNAFHYSAVAEMPMIVGVPNYDLLDYVEEKVKEYNIRLAIHNHGPDNLPYATPDEVLERINGRDGQLGLCIDIGHVVRMGDDPVNAIRKTGDKLFDLHVWDVSEASKNGVAVPAGLGVMDFPAILHALSDINYKACMHIEYASEGEDPLPGIAQTAGYLEGMMAAL